jgi:membrane-associated protease RseP (regulator of RpoE activity)
MKKLFRVWRIFLPILFFFVSIHFLKDITQDILRIQTPLDIFGDAKEDLSSLSTTSQNLYLYGLGGLSFLAEAFLLISIPIIRKRKNFSELEKVVVIATGFLLLFFLIAITLDPRYKPY